MSQESNIVKKKPERVSKRRVMAPPVDIFENKEEVLVVADIPGASPEGLNLHYDKDQLYIEASGWLPNREIKPLFREFEPVDYKRIFELTPGIDIENINADLKDGVLSIHLPKAPELKPRKIEISTD